MSSEKSITYRLHLSTKAQKYLTGISKKTASRILDKIITLKTDPYHSPGVKPLKGQLAGLYRLCIGNYRAVYRINENDHIVIVTVIGPRGNVYNRIRL